MSCSETENTAVGTKRAGGALQSGPRKKPSTSDPFIHHGRHFGRSVHAFCHIPTLLNDGIVRMGQLATIVPTTEESREIDIFNRLLAMTPGLEEELFAIDAKHVRAQADLIQTGVSGARADDTKSLKTVVIDWITPIDGILTPSIARNSKEGRGYSHMVTGALLCPADLDWTDAAVREGLRSGVLGAGDEWPYFLYDNNAFDAEDPWEGFFRSALLVNTFKHIFTSPSSVEREAKATRSGNARIHGMTEVTRASIAYVATQLRFALCASPAFCRTDTTTGSERFYHTILAHFDDPMEIKEVNALMMWWNKKVFPSSLVAIRPSRPTTVLNTFKRRRAKLNALTAITNAPAGYSNSSQ